MSRLRLAAGGAIMKLAQEPCYHDIITPEQFQLCGLVINVSLRFMSLFSSRACAVRRRRVWTITLWTAAFHGAAPSWFRSPLPHIDVSEGRVEKKACCKVHHVV